MASVFLAEPGETVGPARLSPRLLGAIPPELGERGAGETLKAQLDRVESWLLRRALDENGGRRARTARQLVRAWSSPRGCPCTH